MSVVSAATSSLPRNNSNLSTTGGGGGSSSSSSVVNHNNNNNKFHHHHADVDDEDPMKDFQLLQNNSNMVYGQIHKKATRSRHNSASSGLSLAASTSFKNESNNESSVVTSNTTNNNNNNSSSQVVDGLPSSNHGSFHNTPDDDDESGVEVFPLDDMKRLRVKLQSSFSGIPMPLPHRSAGEEKRTKIDPSHPQYELAVGMMLGIREAVSGMEELSKEAEWTEEDFTTDQLNKECRRNRKYTFHATATPANSNSNPSAAAAAAAAAASMEDPSLDPSPQSQPPQRKNKNPIRFKAYAPLVFARLRNHLDKNLFLHSVCGNFRYLEFLSNAKSGSFFFFSHDGKYLIKTLNVTETHFFVNDVLPTYYHFLQHNPSSFISRFYGLYRIQLSGMGTPIYFSIMQSVFSDAPLAMNHTFDLKGSTLGRRAKEKEVVKKDLDILDAGRKLHMQSQVKTELLQQLRRDVTFLARLGIMDYSFLLGLCDESEKVKDLQITPAKVGPTKEEARDDDYDPHLNSLTASSPPYTGTQEDEFIDWGEMDWFRRSHCTDDCSVTSSLSDFLTGESSPSKMNHNNNNNERDTLLSVVHHCPALSQKLRHGCIVSSSGTELYYAGIIDILQPYNVKKWGETMLRQMQGNPHESISCVDPETYANRFIQFMSNLMMDDDDNNDGTDGRVGSMASTPLTKGVLS